jgi:hypothetical protein
MCEHDLEAREAVIAHFLNKFPQVLHVDGTHPALQGIRDIAWAEIPGCPAAVPEVFSGLLDAEACEEASRVLGIVLMDDLFHLSAAMPSALPFLIRLAADRHVAARSSVTDLLVLAAELSQPISEATEQRWAQLLGTDDERPERAKCLQVLAADEIVLQALPDDSTLLTAGDRSALNWRG